MELTTTEINMRIARALGYTEQDGNWIKPPDRYKTIIKGPASKVVPNFAKDQNAISELVRDLKKAERQQYVMELGKFAEDQSPIGKSWHNVNASARERALAWLITRKLIVTEVPVEEVETA